MNDLKLDNHKLMYHPREVVNWLDNKITYPIYIEISPSGRCLHRCIFCFIDYLGYSGDNLDSDVLLSFVQQASHLGLKSIMIGGEGESLLHPQIIDIIKGIKSFNVDVALTTNGVLLNKIKVDSCLSCLSWVKISLDAGNSKSYSLIHGCKSEDFDKVVSNIKYATKTKKELNLDCTIGVQLLLLKENENEVREAALIAKSCGADYFVVKPFTPQSKSMKKIGIDYSVYSNNISDLSSDNFSVIFRQNTMNKQSISKPYSRCLGYNFWSYVSSNGDVYSCSAFLGDKEFVYGNIYNSNAYEIYNGESRKYVDKLMDKLDVSSCRRLCRLDEINCYLWELKHPASHVNFI